MAYYLGLDLGTGSLGWAVTNQNYEVLRAHGKALWGVRLFESANTAQERRAFRTARRRLDRRNWRMELLQGIFADEIMKVDDGFYRRLKESRYVPEDKRDNEGKCPLLPYALFVDKDYTDKTYHKQFPTIYHLRKWLMETNETPDVRLVYLALHHMMKNRGHFLFYGNLDTIREFKGMFKQFIQSVQDEDMDFELSLTDEDIEYIENLLKNTNLSKSAKKSQLIKTLGAKSACEKAIWGMIAGCTVKLSDLFGDSELDNAERSKICFAESSYEEYAGIVESILGEKYHIVEQAKAVYDWSILIDILGEYDSISAAKVATYEKHKSDLAYLKKLVKENLSKEDYREIFVVTDAKLPNYSAYIGMTKVNGKKVPLADKQCSKADFYSYLRKKVLAHIEGSKAEYLQEELDRETFLPKQVTTDNGVLPYQVHLYELKKILNNLQDRMPVIRDNAEKIEQIFTFRIPYYVGPLNGIRKGKDTTHWVQRKSCEKIYPWNFEEVVDVEESAKHFIRRMTNKCTYLVQEDVLPKYSLLYSKFEVLNELNNVCLDGEPLSVELKQRIYEEVFQRKRKVTQKKLRDYLVREGYAARTVDITGIDGDFKASLTAYHDFKEKLTDVHLTQDEKENIILDITLFGDDKKLLSRRLEAMYPQLTERQRTELCNLSYKGWGRLSRELLDGITAPSPCTGEAWTIIRCMWETNDNLRQVLSSKYLFTQAIDDANQTDVSDDISYKCVDELRVSPAVKRQIWQTLQVVKEICKVMGNPPERVFVEMAREKGENKRTESRKKKLMDLYKKCRDEERDWVQLLDKTEETSLRGDKLYLYYTQKGRCMYSGEIIELEDLWDNRKYDIDHIYPQSKVMDDSIDNRVLVKKSYNYEKKNIYPIQGSIRKKMQPFWKSLLDGGFISKVKYERLVRGTEFEPNELVGFVERQIVETRQGTKAVASILKQMLPDSNIVYVKAKTVSQFRQDFDLFKVREMNDLHHAKDAYLNIVVGNSYYVKFTQNAAWYIKEHPGGTYNLKKMFRSKYDIERNGDVAWKAGEAGTIQTVKRVMNQNNVLVTRRAYQVKGGLFDQQLMKKGKGQVPIKSSDERLLSLEKYGGYNKAAGAYFMLVESEDKKGKLIRTIEYVPLYLCERIEREDSYAVEYLVKDRNLTNPRILLKKIKKDTLFKIDGFYMRLSARTGQQLIFKNDIQLVLSQQDAAILKRVLKFRARQIENKQLHIVDNDKLPNNDLLMLYDAFLNKLQNSIYHNGCLKTPVRILNEKREAFVQLSAESKCVVLSEILHIFQCQSSSADLSLIGEGKTVGEIKLIHNVTNRKEISIINQSPTGIYEQEIDLKKL